MTEFSFFGGLGYSLKMARKQRDAFNSVFQRPAEDQSSRIAKRPFNEVALISSQCFHQTESKCHKGAQGLNNYPCEECKSLIGGKLSLQLL